MPNKKAKQRKHDKKKARESIKKWKREQKRLIEYNKQKTYRGYIDYYKLLAYLGIITAILELIIIIELIR